MKTARVETIGFDPGTAAKFGCGIPTRLWAIGIGAGSQHRRHPLGKIAIAEIAQLAGADRRHPGDQHQLLVGRELHDLAGGQELPGGLLPADHDMREPGCEPVSGIVAHRALLGRRPQRIGNPLGGALVVAGERHPDMAVVEDGVVLAVGLLDLVEALGDQEGAHAIAREEGEARLEEVEAAKRRELVKHHQQLVPAGALTRLLELFRQATTDLVEHQADQRFGAADVRGRDDEVERARMRGLDEVGDPPVAARGGLGDSRIAVEPEERHGGRQHAGTLVLALVEQCARGRGDDRMDARRLVVAQMIGAHHDAQGGDKTALWVGEEGCHAGERLLLLLGIEDVKDGADQQRMAGLFPMIAAFERALGINEDIGDVLDVADLVNTPPHLKQRVVMC